MSAPLKKQLRRRVDALAVSPAGLALPVAALTAYLRRTRRATQWQSEGREALARQLSEDGPVILVLWHARLLLGTDFWPAGFPPLLSLTSTAFPGQLGGQTMTRFGIATQALSDKRPSRTEMIRLAKAVREGSSLVIQADGPLGPARKAKAAPLEWARITGCPIWLAAASASRFWQLDSWDRLVIPRAGGQGAFVYRPWPVSVPKRLAPEEMAELQARLSADLDAVHLEADRLVGHDALIA